MSTWLKKLTFAIPRARKLLGTNILEGTYLLLPHSRHDADNEVLPLSKPILDLYNTKNRKLLYKTMYTYLNSNGKLEIYPT